MRIDIPVRQQQILRLFLPLPGGKTNAPTLGEVKWVKRHSPEKGSYLVGIRYLL